MIMPRGIATYPSFPKRRFPKTMNGTATSTKKRVKLHKGHSAKCTPPTTTPPARRQIMVPIEITTYQSLPERRFTTTMSATKMMTNKRSKSYKRHSTHARSSRREAGGSALRDYDGPIHYQKLIPDNYNRNNNNDE